MRLFVAAKSVGGMGNLRVIQVANRRVDNALRDRWLRPISGRLRV
jgi:hypothetical protein